jgi:hypothetical protein
MPGLPRVVLREQIGTSYAVPVRCEPTHRAAIDAPLGLVTVHASGAIWQGARASLRGVGFFHKSNADASPFRLIGDVRSLPSM